VHFFTKTFSTLSYIESSFPEANVLLGALPLSYGTARRIVGSLFSAVYSVISGKIRINQVKWLATRAMRYDETWFSRINAFRNCMKRLPWAGKTGRILKSIFQSAGCRKSIESFMKSCYKKRISSNHFAH